MLGKIHLFFFAFLFLVPMLIEHINNILVEVTYCWYVANLAEATLAA